MVKSTNILVNLTDPKLLRWIFYSGIQLHRLPFRNMMALDCRLVGHRTDVYPKQRPEQSHRCGVTDTPSLGGSPPICSPRCIVSVGHAQYRLHSCRHSSTYKHLYVRHPQLSKAPVPHTHPSPRQPVATPAPVRCPRQAARGPSPPPPCKSVTAFPPLVPVMPKPASQPTHLTGFRSTTGSPS
ncbi:hypothetical protein HPB52_020717 [Rhipicephalus sanguineus]|uniref:Uncharacterized protein n=1 Tax=Rhipicephalus sanguineus TaxID=34632 RepID=A0A9D4STE5_RHISA|nr:hypothetical protein HPB52_020717 [Rhipicephalus sanguineus]